MPTQPVSGACAYRHSTFTKDLSCNYNSAGPAWVGKIPRETCLWAAIPFENVCWQHSPRNIICKWLFVCQIMSSKQGRGQAWAIIANHLYQSGSECSWIPLLNNSVLFVTGAGARVLSHLKYICFEISHKLSKEKKLSLILKIKKRKRKQISIV